MPPALFASLVLLMSTAKKKPIKTGTSSGHITNLQQSILETFDIYEYEARPYHVVGVGYHWFVNLTPFWRERERKKNYFSIFSSF
jgi:hypothetical protein